MCGTGGPTSSHACPKPGLSGGLEDSYVEQTCFSLASAWSLSRMGLRLAASCCPCHGVAPKPPAARAAMESAGTFPGDEAHCPASSTPKPADSPLPLEIHWWPKQNAISVGPYWVKVIPNDLKFFKHCFFILNFQMDKGIRKMMWYFKWSESADRTYQELFLFWTSDIWLAPANGAESIRYANMDTQNLHFHCHVSIHRLGNHILVTS